MASFEGVQAALESIRWLSNVRRDIRANAAIYKTLAAGGKATAEQLAALIATDASEMTKTVAAIETLVADPKAWTEIEKVLSIFGLGQADLDAVIAELKDALAALSAVDVKSTADAVAAADAVDGAVADYALPKRI